MKKVKLLKDQANALSVLYVEDEIELRKSVTEFLNNFFSTVEEAEDGLVGLEKYKSFKDRTGSYFDIVIADINMPHMNGIELCKNVRSLNKDQPIIILSAHNDSSNLLSLVNINIDYFVLKPIDYDSFINILFKVCREVNDYKLLSQYYHDTESLTDELSAKNIQLEKTISYYKKEIELLKETPNIVDTKEEIQAEMEEVKSEEELPSNNKIEVSKREKKVDTSVINSMHYEDHQKISAIEFLEEFEVEASLIDDLNENEHEAQNLLYAEVELTQEMLTSFGKVLTYYTHFLNETIEFKDLSYSISALVEVLNSVHISEIDTKVQSTLKNYMTGIIDDMANWKNIIFIEKNTPDIHYLDASLLDNCSEIELLIHPPQKDPNASDDDDDDDLEFF